jgi:hypothetical protein
MPQPPLPPEPSKETSPDKPADPSANPARPLPKPRPTGQPEIEDAATGDEGGTGFYGPKRDHVETDAP